MSQFVLLWSKQKNDLRIEALEKLLSANRDAYKENRAVEDYVPVYVGDRSTVAACAGHCQMTLLGRDGSPAENRTQEPA